MPKMTSSPVFESALLKQILYRIRNYESVDPVLQNSRFRANENNGAALVEAVRTGNVNATKKLLAHGANPNVRHCEPMAIAMQQNRQNMLKALSQWSAIDRARTTRASTYNLSNTL